MSLTVNEVLSIRRDRGARIQRILTETENASLRALERDAAKKTGELLDGIMIHPNGTLEIQKQLEEKALDLLEYHVLPAVRRNVT